MTAPGPGMLQPLLLTLLGAAGTGLGGLMVVLQPQMNYRRLGALQVSYCSVLSSVADAALQTAECQPPADAGAAHTCKTRGRGQVDGLYARISSISNDSLAPPQDCWSHKQHELRQHLCHVDPLVMQTERGGATLLSLSYCICRAWQLDSCSASA